MVTKHISCKEEVIEMPSTRKSKDKKRGSAAAESRYLGLKERLDNDLFNAKWIEVDVKKVSKRGHAYETVDLFGGAGGISCGLRHAGFEKILSCEIDEDASATMKHNFPNAAHFEGDIREMKIAEVVPELKVGDLPLLIGGPPCQGFSVAGNRRVDDPRNSMVAHFLERVRELRPWFVVIENVPGIITLAGGAFYRMVMSELTDAGYAVTVRILEAADFGVPQLRTRAIFVANRFGLPNPYPKPQLTRESYVSIDSCIEDLATMTPNPSINHEWTKHTAKMEERLSKVPPGGSLYETFRDAWKRQHKGLPCMTVKENHGGTHIHPWLNRVISAREMARLQTFPDDFIFAGTMKRAMWQIGNAVPPRLAEVIGLALRPSLDHIRKELGGR